MSNTARIVPRAVAASADAADELFRENVALFHRLRTAAEQLHRQGALSGGRRGVLRGLVHDGARTVPQMARGRSSSRQHVQLLVNSLAADGLVTFAENPAHRRSKLVRLTARGRRLVARMKRRETEVLGRFPLGVTERELRGAAGVLRKIREALESERWHRLVGAGGRGAAVTSTPPRSRT